MVVIKILAGELADELDMSPFEVVEQAIAVHIHDFEIDDEAFDDEQIIEDFDSFTDNECERITFELSDEQADQLGWLTGRRYT